MILRMNSVGVRSFLNEILPLTVITVSLEPPLPVYLFNVVAGLRDKSAKGYPVKKVRVFS